MYLIKSCLCRIISLTIAKSINGRRVIKAPSSNICWEMWNSFSDQLIYLLFLRLYMQVNLLVNFWSLRRWITCYLVIQRLVAVGKRTFFITFFQLPLMFSRQVCYWFSSWESDISAKILVVISLSDIHTIFFFCMLQFWFGRIHVKVQMKYTKLWQPLPPS